MAGRRSAHCASSARGCSALQPLCWRARSTHALPKLIYNWVGKPGAHARCLPEGALDLAGAVRGPHSKRCAQACR